MYLSRLILNPRNRRVQREIANPYQMHRSLMRAFPDDLDREGERMLFRLEGLPRSGAHRGGLTLLVQSWNEPDWSWLAEPGARGYLRPLDGPNPAIKPFDLSLARGQVLAFRLRANPTVKRAVDGRRKRLGLYREDEQIQWLTRKGERGGFRLLTVRTSRQETIGGRIHREDRTHKLRLLAVQFDGVLQVADPDWLRATVRRGVGSGKGLGVGLLSLAPVRA